MQALCATLGVPPLSAYGVTENDFPLIVEKASKSSSMKGNPVKLTAEEMGDILRRAL
jgi:alcohol dehydrogenase class IV